VTDGQIKALFTILDYLAKMVVDIRADTKLLREDAARERSKTGQELRRLREKLAKLQADRSAYRKVATQLAKFVEPDRFEQVKNKKFNHNAK